MAYKMIDVSSWQGNIDWNKVKASGVTGAIIRAGFNINGIDSKFISNINGAIKAGMHIGIYWFSYAYTDAMAKAEADYCIKTIASYKNYIDMPVFFDWEYDSMDWAKKHGVNPSRSLITSMTKVFCDRIKSAGYMAGFYYNYDYKNNHYDMARLANFYHWYALYTSSRASGADIQQYSSTGRVSGISGNVDMNRCYVEFWKDKKPVPKLTVDGLFGYKSTIRLQQWLATTQDGKISGQTATVKPYIPNLISATYGGQGSTCIRALQRYLNRNGYGAGTVDGYCGKNTIKALQKFLNAQKFNVHGVDGIFGANTAKALQKFLNSF